MDSRPVFHQHCSFLRGCDAPSETAKLVLVFQINCPGCFSSALPLAARLEDSIHVVCIATAFEDFDLNTLENTKLLLEKNVTVGETRKLFEAFEVKARNVAFDELVPNDGANLSAQVEEEFRTLLKESPQYRALDPRILLAAIAKQLSERKFHAKTFFGNRMRGTPTWVLVNKTNEVLETWVGHKTEEEVRSLIQKHSLA
jgi:hypothetical protein